MDVFAPSAVFGPKCGRGVVAIGPLGCCLLIALEIGLGGTVAAQPTDGTPPARTAAKSPLNLELAETAKQIKMWLNEHHDDRIAIGEFSGPASLMSSSGPAIAKALSEELAALQVKVDRRAPHEVNGGYADSDDPKTGKPMVKVTAQILDAKSRAKLLDLRPQGIVDITAQLTITGLTMSTDSGAKDGKPRPAADSLNKAKENPTAHPIVSQVRASKESPYAVEVLAVYGEEVAPRQVEMRDGYPFIKLHQGETYEVNLINDSEHDAAVVLTIDGLNVFKFSENKEYVHWIIPKKTSLVVRGWHRSNEESDRFAITGVEACAASEAKELKSPSAIGTITAVFSVAWAADAPVPKGEELSKAGTESGLGIGTGFGPKVRITYPEVRRRVGRTPRSSVSVRYDKAYDPQDLPRDSAEMFAQKPMPGAPAGPPAVKAASQG